ncbi:hypothetical protein ACIBCN_42525 [Nocardia sp. NPDC051052]|uniref:hypothetical protein n=1 Tax=Nocardia sp. NPDC051052 TaxID=3364322 RepID=UPI003799FF81
MMIENTDAGGPRYRVGRAIWLEVFSGIINDPASLPQTSCPNCAAVPVRVAFIGPPGTSAGSGLLWCDACLFGISLSRMNVPNEFEVMSSSTPVGDILETASIPDFEVIWE